MTMTRDLVTVNRNSLLLTETKMPVQSRLFAGGRKNMRSGQVVNVDPHDPANYLVRDLIQTVRDFELSVPDVTKEEVGEEVIFDDEGMGRKLFKM